MFNQSRESLTKGINELVSKAQIYLKEEWSRVKEEAEKGNLKKERQWKSIYDITTINGITEWRLLKNWVELNIVPKVFLVLLLIFVIAYKFKLLSG